MSHRALLAAVVAALAVAACIRTNAVILDPTAKPYPVVAPDSVRIFASDKELDTLNYVSIARIEASGDGEWTNQSKMIEAMREKAGKLGANGLLLPNIHEPGAGAQVAAAVFHTSTTRKGDVLAIRVLGPKAKAQ